MPKLPSAKQQLEEARKLGHELSVRRTSNPDFPKALPKAWLECTCGYSSTARRSEAALWSTVIWHLGKVLGEDEARLAEMRRNGRVVRENPAS